MPPSVCGRVKGSYGLDVVATVYALTPGRAHLSCEHETEASSSNGVDAVANTYYVMGDSVLALIVYFLNLPDSEDATAVTHRQVAIVVGCRRAMKPSNGPARVEI